MSPGKILTTLAVIAAVAAFLALSLRPKPAAPIASSKGMSAPSAASGKPHAPAAMAQSQSRGASEIDDLDAQIMAFKFTPEQVEAYLARHRRNAAGLITAFHASGDTNYLREAATNFPDDPQLQWIMVTRNFFPEEQRQWLDRFKASSPDNSVADYLSAYDHFERGETNLALADLTAATGKTRFKDYTMDGQLNGEEMVAEAGITGRLATALAREWAAVDLTREIVPLKYTARFMEQLELQYAASGDPAAAADLAQTGLALADRLQRGDAAKFLISQSVGIAIEAIVLEGLDQNASYDFLGGKTPVQRERDLRQWKSETQKLIRAVNPTLPGLSESDWINYTERRKFFGDVEAWRWLQQTHPAPEAVGP